MVFTTKLKLLLKEFIDLLLNKESWVCKYSETFVSFGNILISNIPNILEITRDEPGWKFDIRNYIWK